MINRVGQQLGNYRLIRSLGQGGFAEVYLGEHLHLGTQAAIKVSFGQLSPQQEQEFRDEARTIAKLIHPHIIRVLDFGIENRTPYLVMEYAPHGTLLDRHPEGVQAPLAAVVSYVKQIAKALQYAHDQKIIHRDIKPENILVGHQNELLVSDFGIAVVAHSTATQQLQTAKGTVQYVAPEQIQQQARLASDQYALGVMVYLWLTGRFPFEGTWVEIRSKHLSASPQPLRAIISSIPQEVEQVVLKALEKDPKQRFPTVQAFADALEQASIPPQQNIVALPQNQPIASPQSVSPPIQQAQIPGLDALFREFAIAQAASDLELAVTHGQEILRQDPNYKNGTFAPQVQNVLRRLHPIRVERFRQQAIQAHRTGAWDQEIDVWHEVIKLEPRDAQALERLPIAEHNQKYAWMYENAQQLVTDGKLDAAKIVLQELWSNAPYYSDPAGLAMHIGGIQVLPSYEEASALRLEQETERREWEAEERRKNQKKAERKQRQEDLINLFTARDRKDKITDFIQRSHLRTTSLSIWYCYFFLLFGLGSTIGMMTQSWLWSTTTVVVVAVLAYVFGYQKTMSLLSTLGITALSIFIAGSIAKASSTVNYNQSQVTHLWILGTRTTLVMYQLYFGLLMNVGSSFLTVYSVKYTAKGWHESLSSLLIVAFLVVLGCSLLGWPLLMLIGTVLGWGFGFGIGWEIAVYIGLLLSGINSIGIGAYVAILLESMSWKG